MAYLSPGVYVTEKDMSAIVPNVSDSVAFFAGEFNKGPVDTPYVITNKAELEQVFGTPDNRNYNQYFQCWKFLDYSDQLVITRAYTEFTNETNPTANVDAVVVAKYENFTDAGTQFVFEINAGSENFNWELPQFQEGDIISFEDTVNDSYLAKISNMTRVDQGVDNELCIIQVEGSWLDATNAPTPNPDGLIWLHSAEHKNGETEAFFRGPVDETNLIPTIPMAADPDNIDYKDADYVCFGKNRLGVTYELIKSDEHWDYLQSLDVNPLANFKPKSKLKFFNRTPGTEKVEIAIANWYDFKTEYDTNNNPYNNAIAFRSESSEGNYENMYLTDLFQYFPAQDQVAIAIKQGDIIETFIVSMDVNAVDGNGKSNYIETVINEQSNLVYVIDNDSINDLPATYLVCDRFGLDSNGDPVSPGVETYNLIVQGGKNPKVTIGDIRNAYFSVEDKEKYEIDVIIGNEWVYDSGDNLNVAIDLAEARKDCIAYVGARYSDTVGKKANDAVNAIVKYITDPDPGSTKLTRSMFGAFFANYFRIYDPYNKKYRWINVAGDMAGIRCSVNSDNAAWWVSAGMKRGVIRGIDRMAFSPNQAQRDNLYKNGANPLVTFPGTGHLVWGNKTLLSYASSFDRINVRSLFNTLERAMAKAARSQVFEFNDSYTRNAILAMFNPYLASIKAARGITDYLVVCDETNNTPDVISRNELRVDIYIKPNYASEFVVLNFVNVGTRSFATVVGA